jgi:hypothetical protein
MPRPQLIDLPPFFRVIPIFTRVLERRKTKKVATADDFSLLVERGIELSNLIWEGLIKIDEEIIDLNYLLSDT